MQNADLDLVEQYCLACRVTRRLTYPYYFDGPHFPELGLAVYCEKGKKNSL